MRRSWLVFALPIIEILATGDTETLVGIVGKDFVMIGADSSLSSSISLTASNLDKIAVVVDPKLFTEEGGQEMIPSSHPRQQAILVAAAGDAAVSDRLVSILRAHSAIREFEAGVGCDVSYVNLEAENNRILADPTFVASEPGIDVEAVAHMARSIIASALRSRNLLDVRLLIAGLMYNDEDASDLQDFVSQQVQWQLQQAASNQNPSLLSSSSFVPAEADAMFKDLKTSSAPSFQPRLFWLDQYGALQELQYGAHGYGSNFILSVLDNGYRPNMNREDAAALLMECFAQLRQRYVINSPQPPCIKCVDAVGCRTITNLEKVK